MVTLSLLRLMPAPLARLVVPRLRFFDLLRAIQLAHVEAGLPRPLEGQRVLEIGCGAGLSLFPLALQGATVAGADGDAGKIKVAQRLARALGLAGSRFQVATLQSLPFREKSVDVVIVGESLAEGDEMLAFKEMARVLRPGGLLALTVFAAERGRGWLRLAPPAPQPRRFDATDLRQKLELMGFEVVDSGAYLTGIGAVSFALLVRLVDRRTLSGRLLYALLSLLLYLPAVLSDAMGSERSGYGLRVFAVRRTDSGGPPRSNGNGHGLSLKYTAPLTEPTHAVGGPLRVG